MPVFSTKYNSDCFPVCLCCYVWECNSKSQLALLYSTFHKVIQHLIVSHACTITDRYQQTLSLTLNDSMTNRLRIPVYMCVLARQTSRSKPSAQRHSNIPYKATVQPGYLQISWLARYARQLATSGRWASCRHENIPRPHRVNDFVPVRETTLARLLRGCHHN